MQPFTVINSRVVCLPVDDIDTDQIIPARFLKVTDKSDLALNLFADWRYNNDGSPKMDFILNQPASKGCQILLAGNNFGCGSSREHAPWALTGYGFRVVVAVSFGDIFRNNALKNGLLPVQVEEQTYRRLKQLCLDQPTSEWIVDLQKQILRTPDTMAVLFKIDPFSKTCLFQGKDELEYLLSFTDRITAYEERQVLHD